MVHLDARRDGVVVPNQFRGQQDLRLNLSHRFSGTQMEIEEEVVEATLTFGGVPFRCRIPFPAVYALTSHVTGAGLVFPESLPEEILHELQREIDVDRAGEDDPVPEETRAPRARAAISGKQSGELGRATKAPHLRIIQGEKKQ